MDREQLLRDRTYKEDGLELEKRIFYTLMDNPGNERIDIRAHRTAKLMSLLIAKLADEGHLSQPDIDALLLECIN
ncbi:hypothetical protein [Cupriavidus gilardii]|uniref:hypothetical protein n=1 Tax=Cupriavidus gilardii TaxID=82541 RepID=UPI0021C07E52|nr:hypothetical protein [Cupriavidus gilardii]MCT9125511.1 hypothetical protein [Cupriavidus gilardii]